MKPGHPFETKELDRLRAKQRATLQMLPDEFVERALSTRRDHDDQDLRLSPGVHEIALRVQVEELLDAESGVIDALTDYQAVSAREEAVSEVARVFAPGELLMKTVEDLHAKRTAAQPSPNAQMTYGVPLAKAPELQELLFLLVAADELASDGYKDPRAP